MHACRSHRADYLPGATSKAPRPVMVHFNYHPDKHKRMLCIMDRWASAQLRGGQAGRRFFFLVAIDRQIELLNSRT